MLSIIWHCRLTFYQGKINILTIDGILRAVFNTAILERFRSFIFILNNVRKENTIVLKQKLSKKQQTEL